MKITIKINLDTILNRVYSESAWRSAYRTDAYTLTPDNERMIALKVGQGLNELLARMAGYVAAWNYNPNIEQDNVSITLQCGEAQPDGDIIRDAITEALAFYALLQFYGEEDTYYGAAWRKHRAHIMLLLCYA